MAKEKDKTEPLLFKDFQLEQLTFEVRFTAEQFYLDKFRSFWRELEDVLPGDFKFIENNEATVLHYNKKFEIRVSSDKFAVIQMYPDSEITEFLKVSKAFFDVSAKVLEIDKLVRIGLRPIYAKDYETPISVAEVLYQTPYIKFPDNLHLSENGIPLIPNYAIGWQDEEKGISYRLQGKSGRLNIDLPIQLAATKEFPDSISKVYNQVILDIDIYIHKQISLGQFIPNEWIKQAHNTAKKEGSKFFGEK